MSRLRVRDPSGLCRACGGFVAPTVSSQKRSHMDLNPRGITLDPPRRRIRRKRHVVFDLPEVVLDLDAEHSPYVRPFTKRDAQQQKAKWGYNPVIPQVKSRVDDLMETMLEDEKKMLGMLATRHDAHKISDHDMFSVALLGGNASASSQADGGSADEGAHRRKELLKERDLAMRANGIPQRILDGNANTIIHFMLHRQQVVSKSRETAPASTEADADTSDTFENAVQRCKTVAQLERLCSNTLSSGLEAISPASMDHVARDLGDSKHVTAEGQRQGDVQHALKLVNNFTVRRLSANADLSPSMSLLGLVMAANLGLLPAIMQYLHICLSQGFIGTSKDKPETLGAIGQGILKGLEQGHGLARGTRPEIFTLLTGRSLLGDAVQPALFGSSLSSSEVDPHTHHIYVQLLGELGAYRLLWHSWKRSWKTAAKERMRQYVQYYRAAFVRCAEVLHDANSIPGLDCSTATGDLGMDARLDLKAIDALDAHYASSTSPEAPYASHVENPPSWDDIRGVFQNPDISEAVARINSLIK